MPIISSHFAGPLLCAIIAAFACGCAATVATTEHQQPARKWQPLFDGRTLNGWTPKVVGYPAGEDPLQTFRVKDGVIYVSYDKYGGKMDGRWAHLFYKEPFKAFHLSLDYRFVGEEMLPLRPTPVNSGVMFDSQSPESMALGQGYPIAVEGQLLGAYPAGPPRFNGSFCTMGTKIFGQDKDLGHCVASSVAPASMGTWVHYELEVTADGHASESIDGKSTVSVDRVELDPSFTRFPIKNLIEAANGRLQLNGGYIALQSEGHPIEFRNIRIMPLD
jgi:hypothetical protein